MGLVLAWVLAWLFLELTFSVTLCELSLGAGGGTRTRTGIAPQRILSPLRLPFRHTGPWAFLLLTLTSLKERRSPSTLRIKFPQNYTLFFKKTLSCTSPQSQGAGVASMSGAFVWGRRPHSQGGLPRRAWFCLPLGMFPLPADKKGAPFPQVNLLPRRPVAAAPQIL